MSKDFISCKGCNSVLEHVGLWQWQQFGIGECWNHGDPRPHPLGYIRKNPPGTVVAPTVWLALEMIATGDDHGTGWLELLTAA